MDDHPFYAPVQTFYLWVSGVVTIFIINFHVKHIHDMYITALALPNLVPRLTLGTITNLT